MKLDILSSILAMIALAGPAAAAITVIGNSAAEACYDAALMRGSGSQSIKSCDIALAEEGLSHHDMVATYVNRGILRMHDGNIEGAIADFDQSISLDPEEAEAYLNKAVALSRLSGGWARALSFFDLAIAKNTQKPALAYFGRGLAHEMTGNIRSAYRDYRQASILDPNWSRPQDELSRFKVRR